MQLGLVYVDVDGDDQGEIYRSGHGKLEVRVWLAPVSIKIKSEPLQSRRLLNLQPPG